MLKLIQKKKSSLILKVNLNMQNKSSKIQLFKKIKKFQILIYESKN